MLRSANLKFFLTAGFLSMLCYYLPVRAQRPICSYRPSILSFWGITFFYMWAGSHHLHYTAPPTLGPNPWHDLRSHAAGAVMGIGGECTFDAERRVRDRSGEFIPIGRIRESTWTRKN